VTRALEGARATIVFLRYAKRSAGRVARLAAFAANPGIARRISATTSRMK